VEIERLLSLPTFADNLPAFFEAFAGLSRRNIESPEVPASRESDDESAVAEIIEQGQLLAQPHRMMQRQAIAHQADFHLLGEHCRHGSE
jgi:hypothetical protein